jgi:hypothetical protein
VSEAGKNLGQVMPSAGQLTEAYRVPAGKSAVLSTAMVCNQSDEPALFSISHALNTDSDLPAQYLYSEKPLAAHSSWAATLGICMGAGDRLRVKSNSGRLSFNVYGAELT